MTIFKVEIREGGSHAELEENSGQRFASGEGVIDKVDWDKMHEALDILKKAREK